MTNFIVVIRVLEGMYLNALDSSGEWVKARSDGSVAHYVSKIGMVKSVALSNTARVFERLAEDNFRHRNWLSAMVTVCNINRMKPVCDEPFRLRLYPEIIKDPNALYEVRLVREGEDLWNDDNETPPELEYSPASGLRVTGFTPAAMRSATLYRQNFPGIIWMFNPWTGDRRLHADVVADPDGLLVAPPKGKKTHG